mmetsp:Transcript_1088/g.2388  ORF Transcript_1088/g.2388 Transcript_1088/m.2388 type:complete len:91 (-) Transcript_1088:117-389(-)
MTRTSIMIAGRRLMSNVAQQSIRKSAPANKVADTLEHIDLAKCKEAMKEYNNPPSAAAEPTKPTAWANIIPLKDPSEYKEMVKEFNDQRN